MFYELFDYVIGRSITASAVIAAVLIVRAFMGKMPKRYSYTLWIIVAVRLLCPVGLVSSVSVFNLLGEHKVLTTEYWQERSTGNGAGQQDSNSEKQFDDFISGDKNEDLEPAQEAEIRRESLVEGKIDTEESSPFARYGTIVWLSIAVMLTIWNVISLFLMKRKISSAIRFRDNVYECDGIPTPFVMGFVSPKIYIPFRLDEKEREYIIKHERHHIDRKDNIVKPVAVLLTCIYWFHPLVWISYFLMIRDMEMSCDEYVLQNSTRDIRENYGRSLLGFATNQRNTGVGLIAFGESDTRKRVKHIMKFKECGKWIGMIAVGLNIATGVVCLTDANDKGIDTTVIASPKGIYNFSERYFSDLPYTIKADSEKAHTGQDLTDAKEQEIDTTVIAPQEGINDFLERYFSDLLCTIKADSEKDYTRQDFSSVKGYIAAKMLVNTRHVYKKLLGGIEDVRINEVTLEDISTTGDEMEAMVYVKYSFICPEDEEECPVGTLYRVILSKTEDGYCVLDLDNDDIEIRMAKEAILGNSDFRNEVVSDLVSAYNLSDTESELDYAVADAYFAKLEENTESLLQDDSSRGE